MKKGFFCTLHGFSLFYFICKLNILTYVRFTLNINCLLFFFSALQTYKSYFPKIFSKYKSEKIKSCCHILFQLSRIVLWINWILLTTWERTLDLVFIWSLVKANTSSMNQRGKTNSEIIIKKPNSKTKRTFLLRKSNFEWEYFENWPTVFQNNLT